jgi:hypothetical protein
MYCFIYGLSVSYEIKVIVNYSHFPSMIPMENKKFQLSPTLAIWSKLFYELMTKDLKEE